MRTLKWVITCQENKRFSLCRTWKGTQGKIKILQNFFMELLVRQQNLRLQGPVQVEYLY